MSRALAPVLLIPLLVPLVACNRTQSDGGSYSFEERTEGIPFSDYATLAHGWALWESGGPVLEGTELRAYLLSGDGHIAEADGSSACLEHEFVGIERLDSRQPTGEATAPEPFQLRFATAVDASWTLRPRPDCELEVLAGTPEDRFRFEVLPADRLEGRFTQGPGWAAERGGSPSGIPDQPGEWPEGWLPDPELPFLAVVGDEPTWIHAFLVDSEERKAALTAERASVRTTEGTTLPRVAEQFGHFAEVRVESGARLDLELLVGGERWGLGSVVGVPADSVQELRLTPIYLDAAEPGGEPGFTPLGIYAQGRAGGRPVAGLEPVWTVLGGDPVFTGVNASWTGGADVLGVQDICLPLTDGEVRSVRVRAEWNGLSSEVELRWKTRIDPEADPDAAFEPPDGCPNGTPDAGEEEPTEAEAGCGCSGGGRASGAGGGGLLMLLGLLVGSGRRGGAGARVG